MEYFEIFNFHLTIEFSNLNSRPTRLRNNTPKLKRKIIYDENKYYFDLILKTKFIKNQNKVGGHEKGGQIWNRTNMVWVNIGVPL